MEVIDMSKIKIPYWNVYETTGYKPVTTFWDDFSIAEHFGEDAVILSFYDTFNLYRDNVIYITELSMVLNHKGWHYYVGEKNKTLSDIYFKLWEKVDQYCVENLKGEDSEYYFRVTD